jgi:hypothetical protein
MRNQLLKNISENWHFIGLLQIVAGIVSYIYGFIKEIDSWNFFWICPLVAIITGTLLLFKNHFGISAAIVWIICAPLLAFLANPIKAFEIWHIHHFISVIVLLLILFNLKKIWNPKGFVFGLTSYYAYIMITSYMSQGKVNFFYGWYGHGEKILYLGIFFAVSSIVIIFWDKSDKNKAK